MPVWICATCANQYPDQDSPPPGCVICSDERQWVPAAGQRWTTAAELAAAGLAMRSWWTDEAGQFGLSLSVPA